MRLCFSMSPVESGHCTGAHCDRPLESSFCGIRVFTTDTSCLSVEQKVQTIQQIDLALKSLWPTESIRYQLRHGEKDKTKQKAVVRRLLHFFSADTDGLVKKMQACFKYLWMLALKKFLDVRNYVRRATHCPWGTNELASTNTFRSNDKIHLL